MEFSTKTGSPEKQRAGCIVVGIYEKRKLSPAAQRLDAAADGAISAVLRAGDLSAKVGHSLLLHKLPGIAAERVLLVGCGRERDLDEGRYGRIVRHAVTALKNTGAKDAVSWLPEISVKGRDLHWKVRHGAVQTRETLYSFDRLKSTKGAGQRGPQRMAMGVSAAKAAEQARRALAEGEAIADGVALARDLGNLPGNICTPSYLAGQAEELAAAHSALKVQVLDEKAMEKLGMGALLSVARGSREPPRLIVLEYKAGPKDAAPIALVGKGVTFDSGGISLKPAQAMDEMKYDMCGAASVLGSFKALAQMGLKINAVGLIPATENLPGGRATKPGDVVTSMSGQTIEVLNTDAEGRLILSDALTYAERYKPAAVVDIATLTGACVVALGRQAIGLFSNHNALARELLAAGELAWDRAWELPLWPEYKEQLKSNFADVANIGGPEAGAVTAACFLSRFTDKYRWAHLDIAGTAWLSGKEKGATGRPVGLLVQFLMGRAGKA